MALSGEHTVITYDDQGNITQLDAYVPKLASKEVDISIDLNLFSSKHPLVGTPEINQEIDYMEDDERAYIVAYIGRTYDRLSYADNFALEDSEEAETGLIINQHIGYLGSQAVAIAVSTYDIGEALLDAPDALAQPQVTQDLIDDYSSSVN